MNEINEIYEQYLDSLDIPTEIDFEEVIEELPIDNLIEFNRKVEFYGNKDEWVDDLIDSAINLKCKWISLYNYNLYRKKSIEFETYFGHLSPETLEEALKDFEDLCKAFEDKGWEIEGKEESIYDIKKYYE